jgi:hypothetical protein
MENNKSESGAGLECFNKHSIRCSKGCIGPVIGNGDGVKKCEYASSKNSELVLFVEPAHANSDRSFGEVKIYSRNLGKCHVNLVVKS